MLDFRIFDEGNHDIFAIYILYGQIAAYCLTDKNQAIIICWLNTYKIN
jgi:hypothetical protein